MACPACGAPTNAVGPRAGKAQPEPVGAFEKDESPYGVRDMAGTIHQWCDDWLDEKAALTHVRGGSWGSPIGTFFRSASRDGMIRASVLPILGFRPAHVPTVRWLEGVQYSRDGTPRSYPQPSRNRSGNNGHGTANHTGGHPWPFADPRGGTPKRRISPGGDIVIGTAGRRRGGFKVMVARAALKTGYLAPEDKRRLLHRINRFKGHADAVARMIEEGGCVDEILGQVGALKGAAVQLAIVLAQKHLANCAATWMPGSREEVVRRIANALAAVM